MTDDKTTEIDDFEATCLRVQRNGGAVRRICDLARDALRLRSAQTASAELVRAVAYSVIHVGTLRPFDVSQLADAIADRVAAQLTAPPPGHVCPVPYGLGPEDLDVLSELVSHAELVDWPRARAVLEQILAMHRAHGTPG